MLAHPENRFGIVRMPRRALIDREKTPRVLVVFLGHENPYPSLLCRAPANILLPDNTQEQGPSAIHDGHIGNSPIAVVRLKAFNNPQEKRV